MSTSLMAAIDAAKTNAAAIVAQPTALAPVAAGRAVSLDDVMNAGTMSVDDFLKVSSAGLAVGKLTDAIFEELVAEIDMSAVRPCFSVRYNAGSTTYKKTYDRATTHGGGPSWAETVAAARNIDPKCKGEYPTVDMPMTVVEPIKDRKGNVVIQAGVKLGHTFSVTGFAAFRQFNEKRGDDTNPRVKIGYTTKKAPGVQPWGVLTMEYIAPDEAE